MDIAAGVRARDRAAIASALNLLEDRRAEQRDAQRALMRSLADVPRAPTIGVTGPPGAGKSTLCAALARAMRKQGRRVGVVAVDPSSVRSGGALLGDRLRIVETFPDPGLFVRSLASGGALGGLAPQAAACVELLACASDVVLVETVGVGQNEIDVGNLVDLTIVVVQPASGDTLQFLKAGLLEIPDLLVVNKSDLGDVAVRAESDLRSALSTAAHVGLDGGVAVIRASGTTNENVDALLVAIDDRLRTLNIAERRARGAASRAFEIFVRRIGEIGVDALGGPDALRTRIQNALATTNARADEVAEALVDEAIVSMKAHLPR